jgi:hypothetical protein
MKICIIYELKYLSLYLKFQRRKENKKLQNQKEQTKVFQSIENCTIQAVLLNYENELSLLKAMSAKHRSKFAALSPVMVTAAG